jgi:hypothetical protein
LEHFALKHTTKALCLFLGKLSSALKSATPEQNKIALGKPKFAPANLDLFIGAKSLLA